MSINKSTIFLCFCLMFILGVAIRSFFSWPIFYIYIFALVCLVLIFFCERKTWKILLFGGIFLALGFWRYETSLPSITGNKIQDYNNQKVKFVGVVVREPDVRINNQKLTLATSDLLSPLAQKITGQALVTANLYPKYQYGDELEVACKLQAPEPFSGFSYDRYLARYDIYSLCYYPSINLLRSGQGGNFYGKIINFKNQIKNMVNQGLPEPQASLFQAIILGSRRGIPQDLIDKFSISGVVHVIAISGLHISLIINILLEISPYFYISRRRAFYIITALLIFYIIIIGFPASAVRAAIMGWLMLFAAKIGRLKNSVNFLVFAAAIMIFVNPKILRDDVGFQLSFGAMVGLIYFRPEIEKYFEKIPSFLGSREALTMTIAAQLATLPLVVYNFGRLSLVAPLVNIIIIPILPYLMIISFLSIAGGLVAGKYFWLIFFPVWVLLTLIIRIVEISSGLPLASFTISKTPFAVLIIAYGLLIYFFVKKKYLIKNKIKLNAQSRT